jgi:hypothetical protein
MRKYLLFTKIIFILTTITLSAQSQKEPPKKLSIYVDCSNTWCDMQFIRSEIKGVNFSLDNQAADLHILITSLGNGSGGNSYQMIFYGQKSFSGKVDTLSFETDRNATEVEVRESVLYFLKSGLVSYIVKTKDPRSLVIDFKVKTDSSNSAKSASLEKDPWNYWVFKLGGNGNINADANYQSSRFSTYVSAYRTTDKWRYGVNVNGSKNQSTYSYDNGAGEVKYKVKNHDYNAYHFMVGSINQHWSWAYNIRLNQNTFSNYKLRSQFGAGVEYNIFPYKEVNNSLFTITYQIKFKNQRYYDTTIYGKLQERFLTQGVNVRMNKNQKWGTLSIGVYGEQFINNRKYYNLGLDGDASIRISGGLFFNVYAFGGVTRDQVFLPKGNATPQEVLARQRQLASDFNYYTGFGLTYRFGSKLNNFVNPRFDNEF